MDVCRECCLMSGRGLCDELITRPEESYRLWCVVVCDLESSWMRTSWPTRGCWAKQKQTNQLDAKIDASHLRKNISGKCVIMGCKAGYFNLRERERDRQTDRDRHKASARWIQFYSHCPKLHRRSDRRSPITTYSEWAGCLQKICFDWEKRHIYMYEKLTQNAESDK
jgi:hypothetical protein